MGANWERVRNESQGAVSARSRRQSEGRMSPFQEWTSLWMRSDEEKKSKITINMEGEDGIFQKKT